MEKDENLSLSEYREKLQEANIKLVEVTEQYNTTKKRGNIINRFVIGTILGAFVVHSLGYVLANPFIIIAALTTVLLVSPLGFYNTSLDEKEKNYEKEIETIKNKIDEYSDKIEEIYARPIQINKSIEKIETQTITNERKKTNINNIKR